MWRSVYSGVQVCLCVRVYVCVCVRVKNAAVHQICREHGETFQKTNQTKAAAHVFFFFLKNAMIIWELHVGQKLEKKVFGFHCFVLTVGRDSSKWKQLRLQNRNSKSFEDFKKGHRNISSNEISGKITFDVKKKGGFEFSELDSAILSEQKI